MHFLEVLREECGVTSPKDGCAPQGVCGCCTVLVDGHPALACLKKPQEMAGHEVVTLEGIPEAQRDVLARAFVQEGAVQCGYCTPGIMVRAFSLLERGKDLRSRGGGQGALGPPLPVHRLPAHLRRDPHRGRGLGERTASSQARRHVVPTSSVSSTASHRTSAGSSHGVGASAPRYRGLDQTLGKKPYVADLREPAMLHGAVVLAAHPRARVLAIDAGAALGDAGGDAGSHRSRRAG